MKSVIRWAINNTPAMNTLMISTLIVGIACVIGMRREEFPEFQLEIILVSVPYPGASPSDVEEGICQKIEEAVRSIDGIKKTTAVAAEGAGSVILELPERANVQRVLGEVRSAVDRIPSFPVLAEDPEVEQITMRQAAIRVGILGPDREDVEAQWNLREVAEGVRDDLIRLPSVSQATLTATRSFQIDVEIPEATLRRHGLSLRQIAEIIRTENLELPGGTIKTDAEDVLVKGKNKSLTGVGIAEIPLVTRPDGAVLKVADLGVVKDEFDDSSAQSWVNGRPALVISIDRTAKEDILQISDDVLGYVKTAELPPGYELMTWGDRSVDVRARLSLLVRNGLQGLILVFLTLAVFLEIRLAFWVAMGIPFSILAACIALLSMDQTLNMLSTFGFLMALGILVDDAIVIGENIYEHRQRGKPFLQAAVDGTAEVVPSVIASVCTTIIAFTPLLLVSGIMGKFIAVLPLAVICMLIISLFESTFILPCHLAQDHAERTQTLLQKTRGKIGTYPVAVRYSFGGMLVGIAAIITVLSWPFQGLAAVFGWINQHAHPYLEGFIQRIYRPTLRASLRNPSVIVSGAIGILVVAVGCVRGGYTPFLIFPKLDSTTLKANITFPDGTPKAQTLAALSQVTDAAEAINRDYEAEHGTPLLWLVRRTVGELTTETAPGQPETSNGSHVGVVTVELVEPSARSIPSDAFVRQWRDAVGELPGVESLTFNSENAGPAAKPIEFKLLAKSEHFEELERAVEAVKHGLPTEDGLLAGLEQYPGTFDVADDSRPGKWEFQLKIKDRARAMGVPLQELAETVRSTYYGEEVMRLQRGRHEVKLMVRYPEEDRRSLANFHQIRVRMDDGLERPLTEIADVTVKRGYSEINRVDQMRSITITADLDESQANAAEIVADLKTRFMPTLAAEFPHVAVRWEGQQEQMQESLSSLFIGFAVAIVAMFVLLTFEFRSYLQPLLIMSIIPFGIVGAIGGHLLMGMPLTMFSMFGIVALTGVLVNDSIVLIDFINHRVRDGGDLEDALIDAGCRRFRPVLLTSITTIAGLLPMLTETSVQAQLLIPMATSLAFGLMLATALVLYLIPVFYRIYHDTIVGAGAHAKEPVDFREPVVV